MVGVTNLARAISAGEIGAAMYLIKRGANIQTKTIFGTNLLHCAAIHPANLYLAQFLINYGVAVNQQDSGFGITPLFIAVLFGNQELVHCLVKNGADTNAKLAFLNITPLHLAVQLRRREISQYLIEHGAHINAMMIGGLTPLHLAFDNNSQELIDLLLSYGADTTIKDSYGKTALEYKKSTISR